MSPNDIIIGVMGMTGAGKTTFISRCIDEDVGIGHGLRSQTQDVAVHTFKHRGRTVRLIDTPGFDDSSKSDVTILKNIAFWLSHAYRSNPKLLLSGLIYLHPISDTRMGGTAIKNIEMMKLVCGEAGLPVIWLASSMWDCTDRMTAMQHERELTADPIFWGDLVKHGALVRRHYGAKESALGIVDDIIARDQRVTLAIQQQMVDENREVDQTDAGRHLCRTVHREQEKVQRRLQKSAEELDEKLRSQQGAEAEEVLERQEGYKKQLAEKDRSLEALKRDMAQLRKDKAVELQEREKAFALQKQQQEDKMAELERELKELQTLRNDAAASRSDPAMSDDTELIRFTNERLASLDEDIAERRQEEEAIRVEQAATARQEQIFKQTLKVTAVNLLVRGAMQIVSQVASAACVVM